jgi:hypothetical protein
MLVVEAMKEALKEMAEEQITIPRLTNNPHFKEIGQTLPSRTTL